MFECIALVEGWKILVRCHCELSWNFVNPLSRTREIRAGKIISLDRQVKSRLLSRNRFGLAGETEQWSLCITRPFEMLRGVASA